VSSAPIGIFDSGLGGLTVAAAIARALPDEPLLYLGDTARVPYGTRSPATVVRYARNCADFLHARGVKVLVVACNTVSAHALGGLADGSHTPLLGVIRPGAKAAVHRSAGGPVAVLGTQATVRSGAYVQAVHEHDPRREVRQIACPLFVPLVEEGWVDHAVTRMVAETYLEPLRESGVDTVILGCTHYPLLSATIADVAAEVLGGPVEVVDSATAVAEEVAALLDRSGVRHSGGPAERRFFVTDEPETAEQVASRFWGDAVGGTIALEHVDVSERP
jgi:glutamate racemase